MKKTTGSDQRQRLKVVIRGAVQGVGFRPFVYRLATEMGLPGWVSNSSQGVFVEVEGAPEVLRGFLLRLESERPPRASIQSLESSFLAPVALETFEIRPSDGTGTPTALILPDIGTCAAPVRSWAGAGARAAPPREHRLQPPVPTHPGDRWAQSRR